VILFNALSEGLGVARHLFWLTAALTVASALHYVYLASVHHPDPEP
jgi:hypothetical protein